MVFKSYSWSIGTTSFRTSQLNYKIERQLQLLKLFWDKNPTLVWNNATQEKYYRFLQENEFVIGDAPRPDKDAREKTSGLVDLGLLYSNRKITPVGKQIRELLENSLNKENIFSISSDSYIYLLQFLKMQTFQDQIKIRPFVALIYMIEKLDYLTYDEFTYLLPLCKNKYEVKDMIKYIEANRSGLEIDEIIKLKIFEMKNYLEAWNYFRNNYPVTEDTFEKIGINRKSRTYDRSYNRIYHILIELVFKLKNESFEDRKTKYEELYDACKNISGNAKNLWVEYLFKNYRINNIDAKYDKDFKKLEISLQRNIIDFKRIFFEKLHVFKWKVNLKEYFDLNKRYFSLTDVLKFSEDRVELDLLPKYYFSTIIEELLNEELVDEKEYQKSFVNSISLKEISNKFRLDIDETIQNINKDLGTSLDHTNINDYLENEKLKSFNKLIDQKFRVPQLIELLEQIEFRKDTMINEYVTDNATIPTIFEYLLGIIWYEISNREGNILKYMNLSLDADLLPKTHAGGGMADIVYEYNENDKFPEHNLLLEATLSDSTTQRSMEMEPVSRHLGECIKESNNNNDYAILVAPKLDERLILDFRNMKTRAYPLDNNQYTEGLKIIPIDINILKILLSNNVSYEKIYLWFEKAFRSSLPDPLWFNEEISKQIESLKI